MIEITPRILLLVMLLHVRYVKLYEEVVDLHALLNKKFSGTDKEPFFTYFSEGNLQAYIWESLPFSVPFSVTRENPGASGYSVGVHTDFVNFEGDSRKDVKFFLDCESLKEKDRKFFCKELVQTIQEYYEGIPGGKERLWKMERKNTTEQVKKLGV